MEKEGHSSQVDTSLTPAHDAIEHGRKDGDSRRRIKDCRNSKPKQGHLDTYLTGEKNSIL
jgi:hypothetical protein